MKYPWSTDPLTQNYLGYLFQMQSGIGHGGTEIRFITPENLITAAKKGQVKCNQGNVSEGKSSLFIRVNGYTNWDYLAMDTAI